ncbi:unnamed protein product [Mortierella alpina]
MGITKFGEFRKRQKLEGTSITSEDVSQYHTHVDFGYYFHRARQKLVAFDYTAARKSMKAPQEAATIVHTTPTLGLTAANQARDNAGSDIAHMVDYDLRRLGFEHATTTIHLDGSRTSEKAKARQERNKVDREKRREAMKLLEQCEERAADGVAREVFPCAAATLLPDPAINQAENILISRRSVYDGTEALQRKLANRKAAPITRENEPGVQYPSINELEALAPARGTSGVQPLQDYIKWYQEYEELLGSLYRSTWWKRLSWENSKAQTAESGRMFDAIVRSTGMTRSAALTIDEETGYCENLVLVVGDGDFCSGRGKPSMHNSMLRRLILQRTRHSRIPGPRGIYQQPMPSEPPRGH